MFDVMECMEGEKNAEGGGGACARVTGMVGLADGTGIDDERGTGVESEMEEKGASAGVVVPGAESSEGWCRSDWRAWCNGATRGLGQPAWSEGRLREPCGGQRPTDGTSRCRSGGTVGLGWFEGATRVQVQVMAKLGLGYLDRKRKASAVGLGGTLTAPEKPA